MTVEVAPTPSPEPEKRQLSAFQQKLQTKYNNKAFFCLSSRNPLRYACIYLNESLIFEYLCLLVIIVNTVFISLYDPLDATSVRNQIVEISDYVFTAFYTIELVIRIIAQGFLLHKHAFLRSMFGLLDFIVVLTGWIGIVTTIISAIFHLDTSALEFLSYFRAFRLLRPLKLINAFKEMRIIITSLVKSIPMLSNALFLYIALIMVFGLVGLKIYAGALRRRCYHIYTKELYDPDFICGKDLMGNLCPSGYLCLEKSSNPDYDITSFDNIFNACLLVFTILTLEGWSVVMEKTSLATNPFTLIFYFIIVVIGSFFVLKLALVIITETYGTYASEEKSKKSSNPVLQNLLKKLKDTFYKIKGWLEKVAKKITCKCVSNIQKVFRKVVDSFWFQTFFMSLTLLNTVILALDYYQAPSQLYKAISICNLVLIVLFSIEIIIKIIGYGLLGFFSDAFNVMDIVLIVMSYVDVIAENLPDVGISSLRALRLFRLFKVLRTIRSLQKLLKVIIQSIFSMIMLVLLVLLVLFIFSLLGLQLFGGKFNFEEGLPRTNFDNLYNAMLTCFAVITGENWNSVMYDGIRARGAIGAIFFVALVIFGNYIVLNLFIAVLIQQFQDAKEDEEKPGQVISVQSVFRKFVDNIKSCCKKIRKPKKIQPQSDEAARALEEQILSQEEDSPEEAPQVEQAPVAKPKQTPATKLITWVKLILTRDRSLCMFPDNRARRIFKKALSSIFTEIILLVCILVSVVCLVIDDPRLPPNSTLKEVLKSLNIALTIIFTIESILKILVFGLVLHPTAYLRDEWNILDFLIVILSWVSIGTESLRSVKGIRLLRVLRPLRLVNKIGGLKVVLDALVRSILPSLNVLILSLFVFFIYGVVGINLFSGSFYSCSDSTYTTRATCEANGALWETPIANFDNIINAVITLFRMTTFEGWTAVMYMGMDAVGPDEAPQRDYNPLAALYFVAFILVGAFFMINLFVGALIDTYSELKEERGASVFMTESQKNWVNMQKLMLFYQPKKKPPPPVFLRLVRWPFYKLVTSQIFDWFIYGVVLVSILLMCMEYYHQPATYEFVLDIIGYVITGIFGVEAIVKIVGLGFKSYFTDYWNLLDFAITVLSIASDIVTVFISLIPSGVLYLARMLRVLRAVRLLRIAKRMEALLRSLYLSIPSLLNVTLLLFLLYFIYAILGCFLFANVERSEPFSDYFNFENFWTSFITLIRLSTGEDWPSFMEKCMLQEPLCSRKLGTCGTPWISVIYFSSFTIISNFVLLNLLVAVMLENFTTILKQESYDINENTLSNFSKCWSKYDPHMSMRMPVAKLTRLIIDLGPPLGLSKTAERADVLGFIKDLEIKEVAGYVYYQEVLISLAEKQVGCKLPEEIQQQIQSQWKMLRPTGVAKGNAKFTVKETVSAMKIQAAWRHYVLKKRFKVLVSAGSVLENQVEVRMKYGDVKTVDLSDDGATTYDSSSEEEEEVKNV